MIDFENESLPLEIAISFEDFHFPINNHKINFTFAGLKLKSKDANIYTKIKTFLTFIRRATSLAFLDFPIIF